MLRKMVLLSTLFLSLVAGAQVKKGDRMVGATIGSFFFDHSATDISTNVVSSTNSNDKFGLSFSPSYGWFISDNLAIGIAPAVSYSKQKALGKSSAGSTYLKDETSQYNFGLGGFARYYIDGKNESVKFFGQYNLSFGLSGSTKEGYEYETLGTYVDRYNQKSSGDFFFNTGPALGISKFLSNHNAIDFYIGYNFSFVKSKPTGTSVRDYSDPSTGDESRDLNYDQKFTGHNIMLAIGYQMFIGRKK